METSELIKKVRKIEIKTRGLSKQMFSGEYHSTFKGRGMAFSEVREYTPGDDIRSIDWNVTARSGSAHVKVFEEERELTVILAVDVSGSKLFGTASQTKLDLTTELSAILSFSAMQNNDKIGLLFFSDKIEKFIAPKKGKSHVLRIIRELLEFKPESNKTNIALAIEYLNNVIKKRSILFILSDFFDKDFDKQIKIISKKHDTIALQILDENEINLPNLGFLNLSDLETGTNVYIDFSDTKLKKIYSEWWNKTDTDLNKLFAKNKVDLIKLKTSESYIKPLRNFFIQREKRK